jgi:hypothetical protein
MMLVPDFMFKFRRMFGAWKRWPTGSSQASGAAFLLDDEGGQGAVVLRGGAVGLVVEEGKLAGGGLGGADGVADVDGQEEVRETGGEVGQDLAGEEGVGSDADGEDAGDAEGGLRCSRTRSMVSRSWSRTWCQGDA